MAHADSTTLRLLLLVLGAVLALIGRVAWDAIQKRRERRGRDRRVLAALLMELHSLRGLTRALVADVTKDLELNQATPPRRRIKPPPTLPTTLYELIRADPPMYLIEHETALPDLMRISVQAAFTNALVESLRPWKAPGAWDGMYAVIADLNLAILESAKTLCSRIDRLEAAIRDAGQSLGGLKTPGVPQPNDSCSRASPED